MDTNCHNNIFDSSGIDQLNVMSFNCRGLRNKKKRLSIFRIINNEKVDIAALQETYLLENEIEMVEREWGAKIFISPGSSRSKGLLLLFSKKLSDKFNFTNTLSDERIQIVKMNISNNDSDSLVIANCYAPSTNYDNDKIRFFSKLDRILKTYTVGLENQLLCMGDFNCVLDNDLDIISGQKHKDDTIKELKNVITGTALCDTWRIKHPGIKMHSWSGNLPLVSRRLDYIFCQDHNIPFIERSEIKSIGFSDHRAIFTQFKFTSFKKGCPIFKMNTSLLGDISYVKLIKTAINKIKNDSRDDPHLLWEQVKIEIKTLTQEYSRYKQMMKRKYYSQLADEVNQLEETLAHNPNNPDTIGQLMEKKKKLEIKTLEETKGAQVRAGIKWIEDGEKCSKYFLGLERTRATSNTIFSIKDSNGQRTKNEHETINVIYDFYSKLYDDNDNPTLKQTSESFFNSTDIPKITLLEKEKCDKNITIPEVLNALKTMKNGSSPGMDGIPTEFYKMFWNDIKDILVKGYQYSFEQGILSNSQRRGVISLIHKGKNLSREDITNWRPIALTNVDYKILTKTLAIRLISVMDAIIGSDQKGFMKGRNIAELLREIDDIIEYEKLQSSNSIMLAVDYRKAFDTVSCKFIKQTFRHFGFGGYFVQWIDIILKGRLACVKNSGHISKDFEMKRGVRQGCPISPLLFTLAVEILALNVRQDENIKGVTISDSRFVIKQYADDTTFFLKDDDDMKILLDKVNAFTIVSGLQLNKDKSIAMSFGNKRKEGEVKNGIKFLKRIKILGIIFSSNECASCIKDNWENRIEELKITLYKWGKRNLSIMGKITLIKAYGISQFIYIMQSLALPEKVIVEINSIFFQFIWRKKYSNKKIIEKVKRKVMLNDYKFGGLNMIDAQAMQKSFLINWIKKLVTNNDRADWKTIPLKFLEKVGGLSICGSNLPSKTVKGLDLIRNIFWREAIKTWLDFSVSIDSLNVHELDPICNNSKIIFKKQTIFLERLIFKNILYVNDFCSGSQLMNIRDFKIKHGHYNGIELDYNIIANALSNVVIMFNGTNRKLQYLQQTKRKDIYNELKSTSDVGHIIRFWERKGIHLDTEYWTVAFRSTKEVRLRMLNWKILHNIYPTNILLHKMKLSNSQMCTYCNETDFSEHFFFHCNRIKPVWSEIENIITIKIGKRYTLKLNDVIVGVLKIYGVTTVDLGWINHVILVGKMVISKVKYGPKRHYLEILEHDLKTRNLFI